MSTEISDADRDLLLAYARRKWREEQWPLAIELRPVREGARLPETRAKTFAATQAARAEQPRAEAEAASLRRT